MLHNNEMQRTKHGQDGASPLISVLGRQALSSTNGHRMLLPEVALKRLTQTGLLVSEPFLGKDPSYPSGVMVAKPASVVGNSLDHYEAWWSDDILLDAPFLRLETLGGEWMVISHDYIPGPGPGDFVNRHVTIDDAIDDVLDFFLGDPSRMAEKAKAARPPASPSPERCLQRGCSLQPVQGYAFCSKHLESAD